MSRPTLNARELLTGIGVGHFNTTLLIPYMFIAPATTDPKSPQTILIVNAVQKTLFDMGATDVPLSGRLDEPTARALAQVTGPNWERTSWGGNIAAILRNKASGVSLRALPEDVGQPIGQPVATGDVLDFLPDVPGGIFTYAVAGFLLYRHLTRKGRR
jgi:hypothetical protein